LHVTVLALNLALSWNGAAVAERAATAYPTAYAASMKDRRPLVVFVGQPARDISESRTITVANFPEAAAPSVVVGVVRGGEMIRKDLGGTPDARDIQAAIAKLAEPPVPDALAEVNATRAARGLPPYIHDAGLTAAAAACAGFRAARLIEGHTSNDFAAVPAGTFASASGCAAWEPGLGWGSCCTYDRYTYAGAAYVMGRDGRRYMHLFVR